MFPRRDSIERLIWWLIAGTRGGRTRAIMIATLKEMPMNASQLADELRLDYKTIRHHLRVLVRNGFVSSTGNGYGTTYFLSSELEENYHVFEEIWRRIGEREKWK